ncbi:MULTISPECIES: cell division protein FtsL [Rossellomorea]|uniref:cell division protein FtsL n=1 Tax=Rossellomorea TaxID=2837508 RepID=UPI001CCCE980|nr:MULTISPECIES: cell division protein FtsL [Rossellomorea]MCA0148732.1 cell division protein FtsL [Rossellomorea vietnamensis]MCC5802673.1 cell division protein FtsL [Rossellomorea vietnamensis]UTE75303.1 cell division protein FtsL [Rossellomorea sp. KS-H15a]WGG47426.1 cell division protein FtsL [Rossellomorea sp. DA94]
MSNLARKYEQQNVEKSYQSVQAKPKRLNEERTSVVTPGEKILVAIFAMVFCILAVQIVSTQAAIYDVNKEVQHVETTIEKQEKANNDLKLQVSELSTYERILEKAKELGLNLKEKNVKVVEQ